MNTSPLITAIPVVGVLAMLTPLHRAYALAITTDRALVVRRGQVRPGLPQSIDIDAPLRDVRVTSVKKRPGYKALRLQLGDRPVRLYIAGSYLADLRDVVNALSIEPPTSAPKD